MRSPDHRPKPDGWDASFRIGVLTHADVGPESELQAMAPAGVVVHAARLPFGAMGDGAMDPTVSAAPVRAFSQPPHVHDAAELLAAAPLDPIAFAFTSVGTLETSTPVATAMQVKLNNEAAMSRGRSRAPNHNDEEKT